MDSHQKNRKRHNEVKRLNDLFYFYKLSLKKNKKTKNNPPEKHYNWVDIYRQKKYLVIWF